MLARVSEYLDLFSSHAACYAGARPGYPPELFAYLASLCTHCRLAWDVGTGNGQAAVGIAAHFDYVIATDASEGQLVHAAPHVRVSYRRATAEAGGLPDACADLVTVAQALHWFNHDAFYAEVRRVIAPGGRLAAWCYTLPQVEPRIDEIVLRFYRADPGPYWECGRRYIDERYETIPFPFDELRPVPSFACRADWTMNQYLAYVESWSAVQALKRREQRDPLVPLRAEVAEVWGPPDVRRPIAWPVYLRVSMPIR